MEDRFTEIERENRILLEKMSSIMSNKGGVLGLPAPYRKSSLNSGYRKRQLINITMENQALMSRLQKKRPNYFAEEFERERMQTEYLI